MRGLTLFVLLIFVSTCKQRSPSTADLAGNIDPAISKVPRTTYHFGQFKHLAKYGDRGGTFTDEEWQSIPSVTMTQQPEYRRGFYVTGHPAYSERYASEFIYKDRDDSPWMATITFKESCRTERKSVVGPNFIDEMLKDKDFQEYVVTPFGTAQKFRQLCPDRKFSLEVNKEDNCTKWLRAYFEKYDVGIVFDNYWPQHGFWYVRDPQCIERIETSAQSVLRVMAEVPEFWGNSPYKSNLDRNTGARANSKPTPTLVSIAVLMRALYELPNINDALLDALVKNAETADVPQTATLVKTILDGARNCQVKGQAAAFKEQVGVFVEKIDSSQVRPESLNFLAHVQNFVNVGLNKIANQCGLTIKPVEPEPAPVVAVKPSQPAAATDMSSSLIECRPSGNGWQIFRKSDNQQVSMPNLFHVDMNYADCMLSVSKARLNIFCYSLDNKAKQGDMMSITAGRDVSGENVFSYNSFESELLAGSPIEQCFGALASATAKYICATSKDDHWYLRDRRTCGVYPSLRDMYANVQGFSQQMNNCRIEDLSNNHIYNACGEMANAQFANFGVISDWVWPQHGYFFIRSLDCIKKVDATPAKILDVFGKVDRVWDLRPNAAGPLKAMPGGFAVGDVSLAIVLRAIAEAAPSAATLEALVRNASQAPARVQDTLTLVLACQRDGKFAQAKDIIANALGAVSNRKLQSAAAVSLLDELLRTGLGSLCNAVPQIKEQAQTPVYAWSTEMTGGYTNTKTANSLAHWLVTIIGGSFSLIRPEGTYCFTIMSDGSCAMAVREQNYYQRAACRLQYVPSQKLAYLGLCFNQVSCPLNAAVNHTNAFQFPDSFEQKNIQGRTKPNTIGWLCQ